MLEEIENIDDGDEIPDEIVILPPTNCNADLTDEDSGEEENVALDNLPGI